MIRAGPPPAWEGSSACTGQTCPPEEEDEEEEEGVVEEVGVEEEEEVVSVEKEEEAAVGSLFRARRRSRWRLPGGHQKGNHNLQMGLREEGTFLVYDVQARSQRRNKYFKRGNMRGKGLWKGCLLTKLQ